MKLSNTLLAVLVGSHVMLTAASSFSIALVSLGAAGLTGLKFYFGIKLFAPAFRLARSGSSHNVTSPAVSDSRDNESGFSLKMNISLPESSEHEIADATLMYPARHDSYAAASKKVRREVPGSFRLSKSFLRWLKSIDDKKCIHRFFCELGNDQRKFGDLGRLTNMLIMMGGLPKGSWPQEMFDAGQDGKQCPKTCDEHELSKTVDYLERQLFVPSPPEADPDSMENEIPT